MSCGQFGRAADGGLFRDRVLEHEALVAANDRSARQTGYAGAAGSNSIEDGQLNLPDGSHAELPGGQRDYFM